MLCLSLVAGIVIWMGQKPGNLLAPNHERERIVFSAESGYYEDELALELSCEGGDIQIWYTCDGSVPSKENANTRLYEKGKPIVLQSGEKEQVYVIRAGAVSDEAEVFCTTQTYIIGQNVKERFQIPVLCISGNPEDLYGEQDGILIRENGNRYQKGMEAEREVSIALFDENGAPKLLQDCGLRIHGNASREKNLPSFRLYARVEYGDNRFRYPFIENAYTTENALIGKYKKVIVRNSGDDNGNAFVRSELASRLCLDAGFADAQSASPVCVYLNGQYFGVYWLVTDYNDTYFEQKYGSFDGQIITMEGGVSLMTETDAEDEALGQLLLQEYNELHEMAAYCDLTEDDNWNYVCSRIDVNNFLQYVALQNYLSNGDAFVNNFRVYRYYDPKGNYREGTIYDGRYRFLIFDLDETLNYQESSSEHIKSNSNRMGYDIFYNNLFRNLMTRQEARDYYLRYSLGVVNYYFAEERASAVLDEMQEKRLNEIRYLLEETDLLKGDSTLEEEADYGHFLREMEKIQSFLRNRPNVILEDLEGAFELEGRYELQLKNPSRSVVNVDYVKLCEAEFNGIYYTDTPVVITGTPAVGYQFDGFMVNGQKVENSELIITEDMVVDGRVSIEYLCSEDGDADVMVTAYRSKGDKDYVVLTNYSANAVNLKDYSLFEGERSKRDMAFGDYVLEAGESITVLCRNNAGTDTANGPRVAFNLKGGETLYLYRNDSVLLQVVPVLEMGSEQAVCELNLSDHLFYERLP